MTWEEVAALPRDRTAAVLPVGAVEAHGPHLPLTTDVVIAEAMASAGGERLARRGWEVVLLPALAYTAAPFAAAFPGTMSLQPGTVAALLTDLAAEIDRHGIPILAIANAHLDPTHLRCLESAAAIIRAATGPALAFPNLARKPWATRLTVEFRSGACHAGQFESSIVMAQQPDLVRDRIRGGLPANPASLSVAIREGKGTFAEAGGPRAYFGAPADATAAEGVDTVTTLGAILEEAVLEQVA